MATLMTVDEDEEVVLAFCICESENATTMKIFLLQFETKLYSKLRQTVFFLMMPIPSSMCGVQK